MCRSVAVLWHDSPRSRGDCRGGTSAARGCWPCRVRCFGAAAHAAAGVDAVAVAHTKFCCVWANPSLARDCGSEPRTMSHPQIERMLGGSIPSWGRREAFNSAGLGIAPRVCLQAATVCAVAVAGGSVAECCGVTVNTVCLSALVHRAESQCPMRATVTCYDITHQPG